MPNDRPTTAPRLPAVGPRARLALVRREAGLLGYSCGNLGKGLVFAGADLTALFLLTDLLGLGASLAGTLMLTAVAGDLIFDLLAAKLVIRLRGTGRGYRWLLLAGAAPCGLAFALLYAMPLLGLREGWLLAGALLVFRGAYAVIDVPHNALMAQLSTDSRTRGRISGYRLLFSTVSSVAIATVLAPMVQRAGETQAFGTLAVAGIVVGLLFAATMVASVTTTRVAAMMPQRRRRDGDGIDIPLGDPLVLGMMLIAVVTGLALPMFGRMLLYLCTYVLDRPASVGPLLLATSIGQFAGVLTWTAMTARVDKSRLLASGHGVTALGLLLFALCTGWSGGSPMALAGCATVIGFGLASVFMLPWGLLADTVDFAAWRHRRRMETGLFAGYLVAVKASGGASSVLIGWLLGSLGYVSGQPQPAPVLAGIVALGIGVPLAGCVAAMLLLRRFAIGHDRHALVLAALERRAGRT